MIPGLIREHIMAPGAVEDARQELAEAISDQRAHLHYSLVGSMVPRWIVIVPRKPTELCGTRRCIPLHST